MTRKCAHTMSILSAAIALGLTAFSGTSAADPHPPATEITPLATVPANPGYPEGLAVQGNRVYVSGPARFGTAGTGPSAVQVFDRKSGQLKQTIHLTGETLAAEHALSNIALDCEGGIYGLSTQLGLIHLAKGHHKQYTQTVYGNPIPDLPTCSTVPAGTACSPTSVDMPPLTNDIVFDDEGYVYVTDSMQATIFRYAPGGGAPEIWFQSALLEGGGNIPFGPNGVRIDPRGENLYFASTTSASNPVKGVIYRLPLREGNTDADLQVFHVYDETIPNSPVGTMPDQLAFGSRGDLYVSLAGSNQISVLDRDGNEKKRLQSQPGDAIPLDNPAGIAFDTSSKSLLIINHALLSGDSDHFAVLKTNVHDRGAPLAEPCMEEDEDFGWHD